MPVLSLAHGTEYSCIYFTNCHGDVKVNGASIAPLAALFCNLQRTLAPEPSCAVHHGNINQEVGTDKQQRAILHTLPTGLFNACTVVRTANTALHAEGSARAPLKNSLISGHYQGAPPIG